MEVLKTADPKVNTEAGSRSQENLIRAHVEMFISALESNRFTGRYTNSFGLFNWFLYLATFYLKWYE